MSLIRDPNLDFFNHADPGNLSILADYVTDKGEGRISLATSVRDKLHTASQTEQFSPATRALLVEEIQRFGGNTLANLFRGGTGVPYKEILCDVADHLKVTYGKDNECSTIEMAILNKLLEQSVAVMTPTQLAELLEVFGAKFTGAGPITLVSLLSALKVSGVGAYEVSALIANAMAKTLLGRGLALGTTSTLTRGVGILTGPVGWALTVIWAAFDLASPAYRVTVPCVVQIAHMRQKKALAASCPACRAPITPDLRFCGQCGHKL